MKKLRDYIYIDTAMVSSYLEQVLGPEIPVVRRLKSLKIGIFGVSAELGWERERKPEEGPIAVAALESLLMRLGLITEGRPTRLMDWDQVASERGPRFHKETMLARRVTFPRALLEKVPNLRSLSVWISDPNFTDLGDENKWEHHGCFLYLTEGYYDSMAFGLTMSGCSVLQAVVNIVQGKEVLARDQEGEPFGREYYTHPVHKLRVLGTTVSPRRRITALYKRRYMTDEQCFTYKRRHYRACDLLAYPLYIIAED